MTDQKTKNTKRIRYDYSRLKGRIAEKGFNISSLAKEMGISKSSLCLKLQSDVYFRQPDVTLLKSILEIPDSQIALYFFTS